MTAKAGIEIKIVDSGSDLTGKPAAAPAIPATPPIPQAAASDSGPTSKPPDLAMDNLFMPAVAASEPIEPAMAAAWQGAVGGVAAPSVGANEPVAIEADDDNPLAVTPQDNMTTMGITPVMVMNEFLPVQIMGEGVLQQSKAAVQDAHEDVIDGGDEQPYGGIIDLLRPLVFGQLPGGRHGGGFGAVQDAFGVVRSTALKVPAMGAMLGEVGGSLTAAAGAAAEGSAMAGALGSAGGAATAAGGALSALGPVGIALAGVATAGALATAAMEKYADVLTGAAESLAEFSPQLQFAYDVDALKTEMNQYQRGARFGDQLGSFVETKGEFERATTAVWDEVLAVLLDVWTAIEPQVKEIVQWVKIAAEIIGDMREFAKNNPVFKALAEMIEIQADISQMIRRWFAWAEEKEELKDDELATELFRYGRERLGPKPMFGPPIPVALGV